MKRLALTLCIMQLVILSPAYAFPTVLMYHDVKAVPVNGFDVSARAFCEQLDYLKNEGYITLSLEDFTKCLESGDFPAKSIIITFDDGYRGVYIHAVPELRKRGMKAALFLVPATIGRLDTGYPHITAQELKDIAGDSLFSIGSHGMTHPNLEELSREERLAELRDSRYALENMTGRKIDVFAYPYGNYNAEIAADVSSSGYAAAFAVDERGISDVPERFRIPRIYMGTSVTLADFADFLEHTPAEAFAERFADLAVSYDVVVAGGGMGGTAAAIQVSRLGASVLVVEPTNMLGGQATAAGVSTMDDMSRIESGLYLEFMEKVKAHYAKLGKSIGTAYWKPHSKAFEPSAGHTILAEMAASTDILYHSEISDVENDRVTVRTLEGTKTIGYGVLIDATEYGDVIPLAGARYRAGNSVSPNVDMDRMIQDITWTAIIRKYPGGVPENLRPKSPLPGYEKAKKNYEGYVTKKGTSKLKYPIKMPVNFVLHNAYRAVPDSFGKGNYTAYESDWAKITKTGVNWGNDYPGQYKWEGRWGLPAAYLESPDLRAQVNKDALIKTLHFIYYMQNELKESWSVDANEYGELPEAAKDLPEEWQEVARHMPPIPYVRESRRVLGEYTLNSAAIRKNSLSYHGNKGNEFPDAIAIGGYVLDLHASDDDDDIERSLGESQASIWGDEPVGPFQVPLRVLIPASVDNFIAAEKNLSVSRLAAGALRLQPICMMTGQAAGALAALSVKKGIQPREVKAYHVQKVLADAGVRMSLCSYADLPERHPYYGAVQIATMWGLLRGKVYPELPKSTIHNPGKGGRRQGVFGVNDRIRPAELAGLLARAEEITGRKISLEEERMTRGQAVDAVVKAMCTD